jgi:pectin methylesterase-like acyl-CoA thioesterase
VILFSLSIKAFSADLDVCPTCTYTTIQSAINAVENGDRIRVAQGIYHERLIISNAKTITISGGWSSGFSHQVVDPSLTVVDGDGNKQTLDIFGYGTLGAGIWVTTNNGPINLNLQEVVVQDCDSTVAHGGGISLDSWTNPL